MSKQRYVIMRGQVYRYEDKAPFPPSGKSILGAIEYDRDSDRVRCHECGQWFPAIGIHAALSHQLCAREYKFKHGIRITSPLSTPQITQQRKRQAKQRDSLKGFGGARTAEQIARSSEKRKLGVAKRRYSGGEMMESRNERDTCDAQLIAHIREVARDLGRTPGFKDVEPRKVYAARTHFGSWASACERAGLTPNHPGGLPKYTIPVLVELLRNFYVLNKRIPKSRDFGKGTLPSWHTYKAVFGSVLAALDAAGLGLARKVAA